MIVIRRFREQNTRLMTDPYFQVVRGCHSNTAPRKQGVPFRTKLSETERPQALNHADGLHVLRHTDQNFEEDGWPKEFMSEFIQSADRLLAEQYPAALSRMGHSTMQDSPQAYA